LRYQSHFGKFPVLDSLQVNAIKECKLICKNEGIQLVFLSFPVSDEYWEIAAGNAELRTIQTLQKECIEGHHWLDFSKAFSNKPDYFSDPDHLNAQGAALLSSMVSKEFQKFRKKPVAAPPGT
jgi:hypothetical protein